MVWRRLRAWQAEKSPCFIGDVEEFGEAAAFANYVEEIAMFGGRCVGPFASGTLAGFRPVQPDEEGAPWRIAGIADQPVAALPPAVGEVVAAHRLGIARETVRQIGGLMVHGYAAARSAIRSSGNRSISLARMAGPLASVGTNMRSFQEMISWNRP